ncbi:phage antirepressor KilAC domain-containing protein [Shouchella lonarensis]|uniref:Phage regulatory protein, rha family n=1 Tax=Shouchella lonarensis TaxID=1464122 RepID=A0A1G6HTV0_9BACI|nr:phage antirepressor KilAC domain-containing protein [Shouchella lonarensis]SDB96896.1 phage regulatory protein, rha family [Shouchella lonarensis]
MMNELKVIAQDGQLLVDSRDVAEMVDKKHHNLLRDIDKYVEVLTDSTELKIDFSEFFIEDSYQDKTGRTLPCYLLTREGCDMVANKLTGKKGIEFTAAYVIKFKEMEKQLKARDEIDKTRSEVLYLAAQMAEEKERLELENAEMKPKASYCDAVLKTEDVVSVTDIAKDYGVGAVTMNKWLHELGVQYKQGGRWLLYAKYQDKGYTKSQTVFISEDKSKLHTYWTQAGRMFIYELLKREKGVVPMMEREQTA